MYNCLAGSVLVSKWSYWFFQELQQPLKKLQKIKKLRKGKWYVMKTNLRMTDCLITKYQVLQTILEKMKGTFLNFISFLQSDFNFPRKRVYCHVTEALLWIKLSPYSGQGDKTLRTSFFPSTNLETSTNVGISPKNFLTFSFKPFAKLVGVKLQDHT